MPIHKKLLAFQKLGIKVSKDATNPHFRSKYSSLNHVLEVVKPELNKLGVLVLQMPGVQDHVCGLYTQLIDVDDDTMAVGFMPYTEEAKTAQKQGAHNTYNRRFSLVTMLNLEDEDDDGNSVSQRPSYPQPLDINPYENPGPYASDAELDALFNTKVAEMPDALENHGPTDTCKTCGKLRDKYIPGGTSKKTGKPYNGFYACPDGHKDY